MAIRLWLAMVMVVGLVGGCTAAATQPAGPILSVDMLRSRHAQADVQGQVVSPMLLISCYPRGHMRILEQIWVDQKGAILKEWITIQGRETKKEQLSANELRIVREAIKALPEDTAGVADSDLLLVSYHDGLGPWVTRTYSKKAQPTEMGPIMWTVIKEGLE